MVILLLIITVFVTVLVCMKHKTTSESGRKERWRVESVRTNSLTQCTCARVCERRRRSKVCPLRPPWSSVCVCLCAGHNSLTELIVVFLHLALSGDLTHYKSFKLLICVVM